MIEVVSPSQARMRCSLTLVDNKAYTAGHCGPVGSEVLVDERAVGYIEHNYLPEGRGMDLAEVRLFSSTTVVFDEGVANYSPSLGDDLDINSSAGDSFGKITSLTSPLREAYLNGALHPVKPIVVQSRTVPGDSGAPVRYNGKTVAIVQGGDLKATTYIVLLP
jgi:hypothetical protein